MPFRCPACHHFSDQRGHFVAHMKPRKFNCKGWDLLTDAEKDPDSNCITKQEYEEALAAAKAQKRKREEEAQAKPSAQASAAVSEPSSFRLKDIEVCGSNEEYEFLLTDWKTPRRCCDTTTLSTWAELLQDFVLQSSEEPGALVLTEPGLPEFMR
eukprot:jgi/Astpho2/850/Aster-00698